MADYTKLIPHILKWEGGWSNDKADKGGPTMKGVTLAVYTSYCDKKGKGIPTLQQLKNITKQEWEDIFKSMYWDRWKADQIENQFIANLLVDWVWTSGQYGIKYAQQVLDITVDGIVGPKTINAVNSYPSQQELFQKLWLRRKKHFEAIASSNPSQKKFLKGWLNRLNDLKFNS